MKVQRFSSQVSRKVLTGMVVHDEILESIFIRLGDEREPFNERWLDLVARWCLDFYAKYGKAPRGAIVDRFARYAEQEVTDEDGLELIEKFLTNLGNDYKALRKDLNPSYILDLAVQLFSRVRLQRITDEVQDELERGDLERAHDLLTNPQLIEPTADGFVDPFSRELIFETFQRMDQEEELIKFYSDGMNKFLSPHMKRGDFVSFVGPEKRGKSFWLQEMAYLGLRNKRRVLYYAFGDMSANEIRKRLYVRAAKRPLVATELKIPKRFVFGDDGTPRIKRPPQFYEALRAKDVWEARKSLLQLTASKEINLRMHVSGGNTVSASQIERKVKHLVEREGWMPDLVVIDYADLLDEEPGMSRQDVRHKINATWMILRRIALDHHCLVLTATQAASSGYKNRWVLGKGDFSEDKRKNAHVTGMLGLNQTPEEKEVGIYRLNWVALRDGKWSEKQVLWTAGQLALCRPVMISAFGDEEKSE